MTTAFCTGGQNFTFDATNRNCGCSVPPDVFDETNCANGTVYDNALKQCKVNTTATCGTGTVYNDTLKQCAVDTTATDVFDETNCATGTVYNDTLKQCKVDTTAICGEGTSFDQSKSVCARTCISTKKKGLRKVTIP